MTLTGFFVMITFRARSNPKQTSDFVWKSWINENGLGDGICFLTGLVTLAFVYAGLDAALHLAEGCTLPERTVPRGVMASVVIGFITAFPFAIVLLYLVSNFQAVLETTTK